MRAFKSLFALLAAAILLVALHGPALSHEPYISEEKGLDKDIAASALLPAMLHILPMESGEATYLPSSDDLALAAKVLAAKGQSSGMGFMVNVEGIDENGMKTVFYFVAGLDGNLHWAKEEWKVISPNQESADKESADLDKPILPGNGKLTLVKIWKFSLSGASYNSFVRNETGGMKELREEALDVSTQEAINASKAIWSVLLAEEAP